MPSLLSMTSSGSSHDEKSKSRRPKPPLSPKPPSRAKSFDGEAKTPSTRRANFNPFRRSIGLKQNSFSESTCAVSSSEEEMSGSFILTSTTLRSCFRGSRPVSDTKIKRKVQFTTGNFRSKDKVYKVPSLLEYASDLFMSKDDESRMQNDVGIDDPKERKSVEMYLHAYMNVQKIVYPKTWAECSGPTPAKPNQINADHYEVIVLGRSAGFSGVEQYDPSYKQIRNCHIRQYVKNVRTAYFQYASQHGFGEEQEKKVRLFARSLSACDRYWASVLAKADQDVASKIYTKARQKAYGLSGRQPSDMSVNSAATSPY